MTESDIKIGTIIDWYGTQWMLTKQYSNSSPLGASWDAIRLDGINAGVTGNFSIPMIMKCKIVGFAGLDKSHPTIDGWFE